MIKCIATNPVDTGRKLNIHKTFRRRPGRLLNVLCTFKMQNAKCRCQSTGFYMITASIMKGLNDLNLLRSIMEMILVASIFLMKSFLVSLITATAR